MSDYIRGYRPPEAESQKPTPAQVDYLRGLPVASVRKARGKGGQSVNTTASTAEVRWCLKDLKTNVFSDDEKSDLLKYFSKKGGGRWNNAEQTIQFSCTTERSFVSNKRLVFEQIIKEVAEALTKDAERIATEPTGSSKRRRVEDKKQRGKLKADRRWQFKE